MASKNEKNGSRQQHDKHITVVCSSVEQKRRLQEWAESFYPGAERMKGYAYAKALEAGIQVLNYLKADQDEALARLVQKLASEESGGSKN